MYHIMFVKINSYFSHAIPPTPKEKSCILSAIRIKSQKNASSKKKYKGKIQIVDLCYSYYSHCFGLKKLKPFI